MRRRWFFLLSLLLAFGLALGAGTILWYSVETTSVVAVQTRIDTLKPVLTGFRLAIIALVAIAWPWIVNGLYRWGRIDETQAAKLIAARWRIVIWLVVIELVLGQTIVLGAQLDACNAPVGGAPGMAHISLLGQVLAVLQESGA